MDKNEVLGLMKSSKNESEWNNNCDKVKADNNNQYPDYWFTEVIQSGLVDKVLGEGSSDIKILSF